MIDDAFAQIGILDRRKGGDQLDPFAGAQKIYRNLRRSIGQFVLGCIGITGKTFEKVRNVNFQNFRDFVESAGADPV